MKQTLQELIEELVSKVNEPVAQEITKFLEFRAKKGEDNFGKGIIFTGDGSAKQLVFNGKPDRFFSSENFDIARDKNFSINNVPVLSSTELGPSVSTSNLREVGRLKGLIVDGSMLVNNYMFFDKGSDRLGLGTEQPNAALSVAENGIEVMLGTKDSNRGMIGTYAHHPLDIVTDGTSRITVESNGNIRLGTSNHPQIQVSVHGKLSIGVNVPDPAVDLHVAGSVRFDGKLQKYAPSKPTNGTYNKGDIIWNSEPKPNGNVGWICVQSGNPGTWCPFGEIKQPTY